MAWARPPGAPELPSCPLESLEPRYPEMKPLISHFSGILIGIAAGLSVPIGYNYVLRRPLYTALHLIVGGAAVGAVLGRSVQHYNYILAKDRDEVYRQYIMLHPKDFPPYKKELIKDLIEPWQPNR